MLASTVLMIRPKGFQFNRETAVNNSFQQNTFEESLSSIEQSALREFDGLVALLRENDIKVQVFENTGNCPDAVFPNNWFSTHPSGQLFSYPMFAPSRRKERREDILQFLQRHYAYQYSDELLALEEEGCFLEGTGSMVFDHPQKVAYVALSPRSHAKALDHFEALTGYKTFRFEALGPASEPIYHTNVMICVGDDFALVGLDCVLPKYQSSLLQQLKDAGKTVILLQNPQIYQSFAGNMLGLQNNKGQKLLLMSDQARASLKASQLQSIKALNLKILAAAIPTIERIGGGSVRCMLAEIFQPI